MQNIIQKFSQNSVIFEKPGILSENLKIWTTSNYPTAKNTKPSKFVKVFTFSDKKPGFLEIIQVCFNLSIRFCITWLLLLNYERISL